MKAIQLVYATNSLNKTAENLTQKIEFAVLVKNIAFQKQVLIHWAGSDEVWHSLEARFVFSTGNNYERWQAEMYVHDTQLADIPGDIHFALHCAVGGKDYWDNNQGQDYFLTTKDGIILGKERALAHIDHTPVLTRSNTTLPITIVARQSAKIHRIFVRWSTDGWKSHHQTSCHLQKNHIGQAARDHDIWSCQLKPRRAEQLSYAICAETLQGEIWDNNLGSNYTVSRKRLRVMTLNLHCWQEKEQERKFGEIARAIREMNVDLVCFQEVCEDLNDGKGNRKSNAAIIIQNHLRQDGYNYHLFTDWSHIGFANYLEGSAILSREPFIKRDMSYVSSDENIHNIHSRKVIMAQIDFPHFGRINLFSVHLSWWEDGFNHQFKQLCRWAAQKNSTKVTATLLCGDFNAKAGSKGYMQVVNESDFEDQFLQAVSPDIFTQVFRKKRDKPESLFAKDNRIDYIFANNTSLLQPVSAKVLFTGRPYMKVSDHPGYLVEFETR